MSKEKKLSATATITVRFHDCDPLGIVWHGNYLKYFEIGREAFADKYKFDYYDFYNKGFATPLIHTETHFKKPLRYKDMAIIETSYKRTEAAKIIFDYTIHHLATNDLICKGTTTQVFVTNKEMELSLTVPEFINTWMKEVGLK